MPEWAWIIALFIGMSAAYYCGYKLGTSEADEAPSQKAWIEVRKYGIDKQLESEKYAIDKEHEFNLELMERGAFDKIVEEENDEDDKEEKQHG